MFPLFLEVLLFSCLKRDSKSGFKEGWLAGLINNPPVLYNCVYIDKR